MVALETCIRCFIDSMCSCIFVDSEGTEILGSFYFSTPCIRSHVKNFDLRLADIISGGHVLLVATVNECTGYGTLRASNFCFPSTYWSNSRSLARMRTANIENDTSIWTNERCNPSSANIGRMKFVMRHAVIRKRCFSPRFEFNYSL